MLLTNNYNNKFEFVKVIIRNIVNLIYTEYSENGIFDNVIITLALRNDCLLYTSDAADE